MHAMDVSKPLPQDANTATHWWNCTFFSKCQKKSSAEWHRWHCSLVVALPWHAHKLLVASIDAVIAAVDQNSLCCNKCHECLVEALVDGIIALVDCFLNYNPRMHATDAIVKIWKGVQMHTSVAGSSQRTCCGYGVNQHHCCIGKLLFSCPLAEQQTKYQGAGKVSWCGSSGGTAAGIWQKSNETTSIIPCWLFILFLGCIVMPPA